MAPGARRSLSMSALPLPAELGGQVRPLLRHDYDRLVAAGAFEPIELLEGFLVEMSPEGPSHAFVIDRLNESFVTAVARRYLVRVGHPLARSATCRSRNPTSRSSLVVTIGVRTRRPRCSSSRAHRRAAVETSASRHICTRAKGSRNTGSLISRLRRSSCTPDRGQTATRRSQERADWSLRPRSRA
jgi:hypothetical protein